jgi:hypothetical protein
MQATSLNPTKKVAPRVQKAVIAIYNSVSVSKHAIYEEISVGTAWQYYNLAIALIPKRGDLGEKHVSSDVWSLTQNMAGDPVLTGKLTELHADVCNSLGRIVSWEELRFARTCNTI